MELSRLRPTRAEVDLDAIAHNTQALKALAPGARFMAVVKANGYGHGAVPVARAALAAGATWLGVATPEEGVELRAAGLDAPVLVLGYVDPAQAALVVAHDLRTALFHADLAEALAAAARIAGKEARVHVKVDTGMGRVGIQPAEAIAFLTALKRHAGLEVEGIFTHLATADEPHHDYAAQQIARFATMLQSLQEAGLQPPIRHTCNSAGTMLHPAGQYDLVRAGIALYGLPPDPAVTWPVQLKPALRWETRVAMIKRLPPGSPVSYGRTYVTTAEESIATLPVGYADGFSRLLTNRGEVLIRGHRCPVVGRVCMDQVMVKVPDGLAVQVGDPVVLIGQQNGEQITAGDMAARIGTINYEVVCAIARRVPRIYRQNGQADAGSGF